VKNGRRGEKEERGKSWDRNARLRSAKRRSRTPPTVFLPAGIFFVREMRRKAFAVRAAGCYGSGQPKIFMPPESPYKSTIRPEDFAPRPGFNIGIISIIVYLAGIAVHFFMFGGKELLQVGGATAGVLVGSYVGIFLVATLISYFAFAASPSRVVSAVIFCLSIPALVFGIIKINKLADAKIRPEVANATPTPAPVVAAPGASPGAVVPGNPTYNATQRGTYVDQAGTSFKALRDVKKNAYIEASKAYATAAATGAANLTTKEAVTARRKIIADTAKANDEYMEFVTNQEAIYRGELEKTPLIPNDVNNSVNNFKEKNPFIADAIAARVAQKDALKAFDDMTAMLESSWGRWHIVGGKLSFQKPADSDEYSKLQEKYKAAAALQNSTLLKLNTEQTAFAAGGAPPATGATGAASPTAGEAPASSPTLPASTPPPAPSVAASPAAAASPAP
jgi:hypothetical protein